jgi:hypothetical protein
MTVPPLLLLFLVLGVSEPFIPESERLIFTGRLDINKPYVILAFRGDRLVQHACCIGKFGV